MILSLNIKFGIPESTEDQWNLMTEAVRNKSGSILIEWEEAKTHDGISQGNILTLKVNDRIIAWRRINSEVDKINDGAVITSNISGKTDSYFIGNNPKLLVINVPRDISSENLAYLNEGIRETCRQANVIPLFMPENMIAYFP